MALTQICADRREFLHALCNTKEVFKACIVQGVFAGLSILRGTLNKLFAIRLGSGARKYFLCVLVKAISRITVPMHFAVFAADFRIVQLLSSLGFSIHIKKVNVLVFVVLFWKKSTQQEEVYRGTLAL